MAPRLSGQNCKYSSPNKVVVVKQQGHPTRNFDEISVRESLLVLRLSDNTLTKSD